MSTFDKKVKSMTAKEIIMAMVKALTHPPTIAIDMRTYGKVENVEGQEVCFGCAATNTICEISGLVFNTKNIQYSWRRAEFVDSSGEFLDYFEEAINELRSGDIEGYNYYAKKGGFAMIEVQGIRLPRLTNIYPNEDLEPYIRLANAQK